MREALSAIETAQQIFDRYSFDLICARPHQTAAAWEVELKHALSYTAQHLSVYQLTIEPQTAFKTLYDRGDFSLPTDEVCADIYDLTRDLLADAGLQYYEISNYAATGHECRHNLTYWRYQDYAGIGAGAHGRITVKGKKIATRTHKAPEIWLQRVQSIGHACHPFEEIHGKERGLEALMMGLRLKEGLPLSRLETESGLPFDHIIDPNRLDVLVKEGMLRIENQTLYPTDAALCRLDGVLRYLM
jgi:oxygen-independent coproporphyrinogen-3 oxidase